MILAYPGYRCIGNEEPVRMKEDRTVYPYCDSNLNFSTATCSEDDCEYGPYKKSSKVTRQDPMSHRIIEKRRRDRMNNCLADLSRLIPTEYLKKGRGRIEKTEIIEMAIKHMKHLQSQDRGSPLEHYRLGFQECMSEVMRFMVEVEGHFPRDPLCVRLVNHLQKHCEQISKAPSSPIALDQVTAFPVQAVQSRTQLKTVDFSIPKAEPENSNSNDAHLGAFSATTTPRSDDFEKETGATGVSYKYKTNIKLRFTQDLSAHEVPKRQKLDDERRNSCTIYENQSSNQSSPPSSEPCRRISENEEHSHQGPSTPEVTLQKETPPRGDALQVVASGASDVNFNVPIFVLHTKGSYYVPLSIDYKTLLPYLHNYNIVEATPPNQNLVLHPVTINVNFQPSTNNGGDLRSSSNNPNINGNKYKYEFNNNWN